MDAFLPVLFSVVIATESKLGPPLPREHPAVLWEPPETPAAIAAGPFRGSLLPIDFSLVLSCVAASKDLASPAISDI